MDLWSKVPIENTNLEIIFVEMILGVIGEGGTKEKENRAKEGGEEITLEKLPGLLKGPRSCTLSELGCASERCLK